MDFCASIQYPLHRTLSFTVPKWVVYGIVTPTLVNFVNLLNLQHILGSANQ